ncbi:DUF6387 family protein [Paraburkholderia azotifigens]|uniref:DUF6387 family protein n=1 Tax=Paraburkholderia azotifigens TaxID=2057004 RepID=UPI00316EEFF5
MKKTEKPRALIPSSFDLSKYEGCKLFCAAEWYGNLFARAFLFKAFLSRTARDMGEITINGQGPAEHARKMLDDPLSFNYSEAIRFFSTLAPHSTQVRDLSMFDVFRLAGRFRPPHPLYAEYAAIAAMDHSVFRYHYAYEQLIKNDLTDDDHERHLRLLNNTSVRKVAADNDINIGEGSEAFVAVNLEATEDHAVEDFRRWFVSARQLAGQQSRKKRFSQKDFDGWVGWRVLPFLDLEFWNLTANTGAGQLTNHTIGIAIFPDDAFGDPDPAERIRKTVRPLSLQAISSTVLSALGRQAEAEVE